LRLSPSGMLFLFIANREHLVGHRSQFGRHVLSSGSLLLEGGGIGGQNIGRIVAGTALGIIDECIHGQVIVIAAVLDDLLHPGKRLFISGITDGIPLTAAGIFHDLVVATGHGKAGGIVKYGTGTVGIANLEITNLAVGAVHSGNLAFVTGHEITEQSLIVLSCIAARLKLGACAC